MFQRVQKHRVMMQKVDFRIVTVLHSMAMYQR